MAIVRFQRRRRGPTMQSMDAGTTLILAIALLLTLDVAALKMGHGSNRRTRSARRR
jgi:hypothetical protein